MSGNNTWVHNPRQYRPSYSHMPNSTSMPNVNLIEHSAPAPTIPTASSSRRRTTTSFSRPESLHSAPTVARSGLTTSASTNHLSHPSHQTQKLRFPHLRKVTPSRIPSPVLDLNVHHASTGNISTPVFQSQSQRKENLQPKTLRLLGPISPTRNQPASLLPTSRKGNVLSTLTSSFSRSSLALVNTRQSSNSFSQTADPTNSTSTASSSPLPMFTTNIRQIHTSQPSSYWCGRFQALQDRYHSEALEASLFNPKPLLHRDTMNAAPPPSKSKDDKLTLPIEEDKLTSKEGSTSVTFMVEDDDRRSKRVFMHLQALCVTNEAKKSLWKWQLLFARHMDNERLLPSGGKMVDERASWVNRMGRAISVGIVGGAVGAVGSTLGRRSAVSGFRRRGSVVSTAN